MRFVPGWRRLLLIGAPVVLVLAVVAGALVYASSSASSSVVGPVLPNPALACLLYTSDAADE